MYSAALFLIAAANSAPALPKLVEAIGHNDYPSWAVSKEVSAASYFHVEVSANGKVLQCSPLTHIGNEELANEICAILKRKPIAPAKAADGAAVAASYETSLKLFLPESKEGTEVWGSAFDAPSTIDVTVKSLPGGVAKQKLALAVSLDPSGKVTGCSAVNAKDNAALVAAACSVSTDYVGKPYLDQTGTAVPYVTKLEVTFSVAPSTDR